MNGSKRSNFEINSTLSCLSFTFDLSAQILRRMQQSGTPSAYAPTPQAFSPMPQTQPHQQTLPSRQPSHSRVPGGAQSMRTTGGNAALSVQDPAIEARRNLALLVGSSEQAGEGLIDQLEREVTAILDTFERAYEKGTIPAGEPNRLRRYCFGPSSSTFEPSSLASCQCRS